MKTNQKMAAIILVLLVVLIIAPIAIFTPASSLAGGADDDTVSIVDESYTNETLAQSLYGNSGSDLYAESIGDPYGLTPEMILSE